MNCDNVQEFLLTDYLDDTVDLETRERIEEHLRACKKCLEFKNAVMQSVVEPFEQAETVEPPSYIWDSIRTEIEERDERGILARFYKGLENIFFTPKLTLALATTMVIFIIIVVGLKQRLASQLAVQQGDNLFLEQQVEYLAYLEDENGNGFDFGTSVEEYFL